MQQYLPKEIYLAEQQRCSRRAPPEADLVAGGRIELPTYGL